jgi:hypothetical protein
LTPVATPGTATLTKHDTHTVPYTAIARPAAGGAITDPDFGTRIVRLTDVKNALPKGIPSGAKGINPIYPTIATWNADESYMLLYVNGPSNYVLLDGHTYAFIKTLSLNAPDVEQWNWDAVNPDLIWYVNGNNWVKHSVSSGVETVAFSFPSNLENPSSGADPIYFSWDGSLYGLQSNKLGFGYSSLTGLTPTVSDSGNSPVACPSASCLMIDTSATVYSANMVKLRTMTMKNTTEHGDLGLDASGLDYFAGVSFNEGPNNSSGALMVEWLKSGTLKTVIGDATGDPYPPSNTLITAKALKAPGWVALAMTGSKTTVNEKATYQDQEIMLANVNTGQVCRAAHHRSMGEAGPIGYFAQPNVTLSPSGTRIAFPSDWGGGPGAPAITSTSPVDTYVLELPAYTAP